MYSQAEKTQQTFLQQDGYLPILAETFITAKRAEGLSKSTLKYYREKIDIFLAWTEAQAVTQVQDVTADLLRRFLLTMSERHNAGGVHGIYRGVRAFLRFIEAEEVLSGWQSPTKKSKPQRWKYNRLKAHHWKIYPRYSPRANETILSARETPLYCLRFWTQARE